MLTTGMAITAKGMMASIDMNDNIAHNMANINTSGFRRSQVLFKNIYDATVEQNTTPVQESTSRPLGKISMGPESQKVIYEFSQGTLSRTGRPFDVAIEGDGFFKLRGEDGQISYTRDGAFCINNKNMLVTKNGEYVLDHLSKPIKIDLTDVKINTLNDVIIGEKGEIEIAGVGDNQQRQRLQTIGIFDFSDKENMRSLGDAKYVPTNPQMNKELRAEKFTIQQGAIEQSNASIINEMVSMINVSRCYETMSKFMKEEGDLLSTTINLSRIK